MFKHEGVFLMEEKMAKKVKEQKKNKKGKKERYFTKVRKELKLVKWPTFKEVLKYSIATIIFVVLICCFFILLNLIMSWIKGMFV